MRHVLFPAHVLALLLFSASAAHAQPTLSKIFTPNTIGPGSASTATFLITNGGGLPVTDVAFVDTLPAGMTIADPAAVGTTCPFDPAGSITAPAGGSTITVTDAEIPAFSSCTITVNVTAGSAGTYTNPAITLSTSVGSSMSLPQDLTVAINRPGFTKAFSPDVLSLGNRTTLTYTLDNTQNGDFIANLTFTDVLPVGLEVADPSALSTDCNFIPANPIAVPGSNSVSIAFSGGVIAGATCTLSVDVVATGTGTFDSVTGDLVVQSGFTSNLSSGKAGDTVTVTAGSLVLVKSFLDDPVPPGTSGVLQFTVLNRTRDQTATNVAFTDAFGVAGVTFPSEISNDCGGTVTGLGTGTVGLTNGTVAPEGSCTVQVEVAVGATVTAGSYPNVTGMITGDLDGTPTTGNAASDTLFVEPTPILTMELLDADTLAPDPVLIPGDDVVIRYTVTNTSADFGATAVSFTDELTEPEFLPFPILATLPPDPDPPCGAGSSLILIAPDAGRQSLLLNGGSLAAAPGAGSSCTFDVTVTLPSNLPTGVYTNTTEGVTATIDGETVTGSTTVSDSLTVIAAPRLVKEFLDDPVTPGGSVTLQFTLEYPAEAPGDAAGITFTDDLSTVLAGLTANLPATPDPPCGVGSSFVGSAGDTLLTLMNGTMMPGDVCTWSVVLDVPALADPGTFPNTTSGVAATVMGLPTISPPASADLRVAGIEFSKEFLDEPVIPGDTVILRFDIANIHPTDDAADIFFTDSLSSALSMLAATGAASVDTCGGTLSGTTTLIYFGGSLASGESCVIEVEVEVPAAAADGLYINITSNLTATQSGGTVIIDPATDVLNVDSNLLQLTKAFLDDPVAPGDSVTLEFQLLNLDADSAASSVGFLDDLGDAVSGMTFDSVLLDTCFGTVSGVGTDTVSVSGVALAASGSCTLRVSATVPGATVPGVYSNVTTDVTGTIDGFPVTGEPASDHLEVLQLLLFEKSFDGPTVAGGNAVLTFTITNPGADAVSGISFTDDLDAVIPGLIATSVPPLPCGMDSSISGFSFLAFSGGSLPPMGGTCSFDITVQVPAATAAGLYPNTTSDLTVAGLPVADPATADLEIEPPPGFHKTFVPDAILAGDVSRLTFVIDNSDSAVAADDLAFVDNLPAGLTLTIPAVTSNTCGGTLTAVAGTGTVGLVEGSVAAGSTCTIEVDVTTILSGPFVNTTGDLTSTSGNSGPATDTLTVSPSADISVTKTDGVTTATPGESVTYTIVVTNLGPSTDPSVTLTDTFPAVTTCTYTSVAAGGATGNTAAGSGDLSETLMMPPGSSVTYTATCDIVADATGTLSNTATAVASVTDTVPGNNSATDDDTVLVPETDLSILKEASPDPVIAGEDLTYTITVSNLGPSDSTGSTVTDVLPAGTTFSSSADCAEAAGTVSCDIGALLVGADQVVTFVVTVDVGLFGELSNTATVAADETDSTPANDSSTATVIVNPQPGFSKSFAPNPVAAMEPSTLTLTVDNSLSTVDATALDFVDALPAGLLIADPANASTTCTGGTLTAVAGTDTVTYTGGTALAGETCEVTVDVTSPDLGFYDNLTGDLTSSLGNSGTAAATLEVNDLEPPVVTGIFVGSEPLEVCDTVRTPIVSLRVSVEDGNTPVEGADDPAAYLVVGTGPDGDFATASCAGGVTGDDVDVPIAGVTVDDADPLSLEIGLALPETDGLYRVLVCDSITDTAGNALDGDGDTVPGGDFVLSFFRADPFNLFENGHFDDCPVTLDPWVAAVTPPTTIQPGTPGADDFQGSPFSASAHVANSADGTSTLGQCVPVVGGLTYELEATLRFDPVMGAVANFSRTCDFFAGADCGGTLLGTVSSISLVEDEGGIWVSSVEEVVVPPAASSALCDFGVTRAGSDPNFDVFLDALFLGTTGTIFEDGYESGDTSAWSVTVP